MTDATCRNCDGTGWVCEGHPDKPWGGASKHAGACECGAGAPCRVCNDGVVPDTDRVMTTLHDLSGDKRH